MQARTALDLVPPARHDPEHCGPSDPVEHAWAIKVRPGLLDHHAQGDQGIPGTGRTEAQVQAIAGGMVEGNAETGGISLTYNTATQKIDAIVTGGGGDADGVVNTLIVTDHNLIATRSEGLPPLTVTLPYEVILPDATTGYLPAFTIDDIDRIANDHGNICTVRGQILNPATLLSVTTEPYAATNFRGTFYAAQFVGLPQPDDIMFAYHNRQWHQWVAVLQRWAVTSGPSGWRGARDTLVAAEQAVTAIGQTFYADDVRPRQVRRVTAYTAAADADVQYICLPEPAILALQNRSQEGVYVVPPDDVTQAGNVITLANLPNLTDGLLLYFTAEGANTAGLTLSIEGTTYNVFKAGESGGAELFEGGEIENGLPLQLVWGAGESTFYWFGTVLGSAARRDVGTDQHELVALNAQGRIDAARLGANHATGLVLTDTATGPAWMADATGQSQAETDARYILKSGDTMEGNLVVEHTTGTAILSRVPSGNQTAFQGQRMGETFSFFALSGDACGTNDQPGIQFGPGGTASRDVSLCRGDPDMLQTPDNFMARSLDVDAAGLAETKTNLGIIENAAGLPLDTTNFNGAFTSVTNNAQLGFDILDDDVANNTSRHEIADSLLIEYELNDGATGQIPDTAQHNWWGSIYQALTDITVHRIRATYNKPTVTGTTVINCDAVPLNRTSATAYHTTLGTYVRGNVRSYPDGAYDQHLSWRPPDAAGAYEIECIFPRGFKVSPADYFGIALWTSENHRDNWYWKTGITETAHAGTVDYPHTSLSYVGRLGGTTGDFADRIGQAWRNSHGGAREMFVEYSITAGGVMTLRKDGVQRYHGPNDLDLYGPFLVEPDTVNGGVDVSFDLSGLDALTSNTIDGPDTFFAADMSDSNAFKGITFGSIADKLADGTTITSLNGTLTAVGLDIAGLPEEHSTDLADDDVMVIENISDANAKRRMTMGTLADFLADGISITANSGVLSAAAGGTALNIAGLPNLPSFQISDTDVLVTEDVSDSNTKKHFTVGELAARLADGSTIQASGGTLTAAAGFDLHDDVGAARGNVNTSDRLLISAENVAGDPNRYLALGDLYNSIREVITAPNSTPDAVDRFYVSREGVVGDPLGYVTMGQLATKLADGATITATDGVLSAVGGGGGDPFDTAPIFTGNPSDPDRILIRDVSAGRDGISVIPEFQG